MLLTVGRRAAVEGLGTALLLAAIVGSGIMGESLASGNVAIALLANAMATGLALVVLIATFAPLSGAHFNPWVSLAAWYDGALSGRDLTLYVMAQMAGAIVGVIAAHAMFGLATLTLSTQVRAGLSQGMAEAIATMGLVVTIDIGLRVRPTWVPISVACYIASAYWFTSSTSFANPAVTLARTLTDTFAGIRPQDVPIFLVGQTAGCVLAIAFGRWLLPAAVKEHSSNGAARSLSLHR